MLAERENLLSGEDAATPDISTAVPTEDGERALDDEKIPDVEGYGKSLRFRCVILICVSFLSFGSYFAYDSVSATGTYIMKDLNISKSQFGLLYSLYSFPNIGLVLVGGWLIDKLGNRLSALLFCSLICVGSFLVAVGPMLSSFILMAFGRFVFGIGAESSYVVQNSISVEWFQGKHLALAFGITISISRMGSILAFNAESAIVEAEGSYVYGLWTAFLMCVMSLFATMLYSILDKHAKSNRHLKKMPTHRPVQLRDLKKLNINFWLLAIIATAIYSTIFTFLGIASDFIMQKWHLTSKETGFYMSLIDITSLVLTPVFGWVVDKTGKRGPLLITGNSIAVIAYLLLGLGKLPPVVGIMLLGFHFSLMPAALWPCVPIVVPSIVEGTAFGIISSLQSLSLTGFVPLSGYIGETIGFDWLCIVWASVAMVSVFLSILWNWTSNALLNTSQFQQLPEG